MSVTDRKSDFCTFDGITKRAALVGMQREENAS